jgi:hypothetical protein
VTERKLVCLLSNEPVPDEMPENGEQSIIVLHPHSLEGGDDALPVAFILGAALKDVKVLKIILKRNARNELFIADQATCIEAFRDAIPSPDDDY